VTAKRATGTGAEAQFDNVINATLDVIGRRVGRELLKYSIFCWVLGIWRLFGYWVWV